MSGKKYSHVLLVRNVTTPALVLAVSWFHSLAQELLHAIGTAKKKKKKKGKKKKKKKK